MRVRGPVILSPIPESESPFPSGFQSRSILKTEVGKLFLIHLASGGRDGSQPESSGDSSGCAIGPLEDTNETQCNLKDGRRWPSADLIKQTP